MISENAAGDNKSEILEIDNSRYLPSVVCLDEEGHLLTGRDAAQEAAIYPDRAELQPKRALVADDQTRLGDRDLRTVEIVAATLRRVVDEATRRNGGPPAEVALTHPAAWTATETGRLARAAALAGLPEPAFIPEPVAAAVHYATASGATPIPAGAHIAVYDLGGGTFDTAVLRRTPEGFEICGPPGGDPDFGGDDVSEALREVVGAQVRHDAPEEWDRLWSDSSTKGQQRRASQLTYLTQAKESLSGRTVVMVPVHAADAQVRITRAELEAAIEEQLTPTVDELIRTVEEAGVAVGDLAAVYLTGGSSRIPRVSELVAARIGRLPVAEGDPKAVVCQGALTAITKGAAAPAAPAAPAPAAPAAAPADTAADAAAAGAAAPTEVIVPARPAVAPTMPFVIAPPAPKAGRRDRLRAIAGRHRRVALVSGVAGVLVVAAAATAFATISTDDPYPTPTPVVATTTPEPVVTTPTPNPLSVAIGTTPPEDDEEEETPTPEPEETTTEPTARDNLGSSEQDLYDKLDMSDLDEESCQSWDVDPDGMDAAIECNGDPKLDYMVAVIQFDSSSSMTAYLDAQAAKVFGNGDCTEGSPSEGTWTSDDARIGRLICFDDPDGEDIFRIFWSHDDEHIVAMIMDSSGAEAGEWWTDNSWMLS
ncbi:Hsp70 family protein [Amorphoplanes digitatis]|uniref:Hsp70 protein n=1 Tax=Actinoplanes digitatis TaxID=1868 RepID=A0A7W7HYZ6_9ACTN|nr:Hsp70 family protein [Actinoplanes digitatis]MBB4763396.1 hypothetical protein [Actinoplanes digitatis]GID92214.1 hypothetical protein Adi01nite_16260 [Actinoplanes digitatis]